MSQRPSHGRQRRAARPARHDLGEILLQTTSLSEEQLEAARQKQAETGRRAGGRAGGRNWVSSDEVLEALSRQLDLPVRPSIRVDVVDETLIERVPISFCKNHVLLPLEREIDGVGARRGVQPARSRPARRSAHALRGRRGPPRARQPAHDPRRHQRGLRPRPRARPTHSPRTPPKTSTTSPSELSHEPQDLLDAADDAPIIKLVNSLMQHAVKERASDVHLEPFESESAGALPHRRRALRADQAAAARAPGQHRVAHQDHGRPQHRREAPAPGRPHPAQDRGPRLRRAPVDPARSRTASAS